MRVTSVILMALCSFASVSVAAGDLVVTVTGIQTEEGKIGCTLFDNKKAFPMKEGLVQQWTDPDTNGVRFVFEDLAPGTYAVSVSHDLNDNLKVDTNFLGMPKEAWGVSNNIRPRMRAPRFKEAQFTFDGEDMILEIQIGK